jgi:hypothetical protein
MPHITSFRHTTEPKYQGRILAFPVNIGPQQNGYGGTNLFTDRFKIPATKKKVFLIDTT